MNIQAAATLSKILSKWLLKSFFRLQVLVLCIGVGLSPVASALQLQLQEELKVRSPHDGQMERVGLLKPGSIINIPDEYAIRDGGKADNKIDVEATLNNWLKNSQAKNSFPNTAPSETQPGESVFDGELRDTFYPVNLVRGGYGSEVEGLKTDKIYYLPLEVLARKGKLLVVTEDTPIYEAPKESAPKKQVNEQPANSSTMEAALSCPDGSCAGRTRATMMDHFVSHIGEALAKSDRTLEQTKQRTTNDLRAISSTFKNSCGVDLESYIPYVKAHADAAGVPADLLLSILTQESSGRCNIINSESNRTQSVGLFQINTGNSKYRRCSSEQKRRLKTLTIDQMYSNALCLENPIVNLSESIRILKEKVNTLTRPTIRLHTANGVETYRGFDPERMKDQNGNWTPEMWRLVASAYNGGERWVLRAKHDLETFAYQHKEPLDAHNWEDLRVFYLRRHLDRYSNGHDYFFKNRLRGRAEHFALSNLAYAENMVPRQKTFRATGRVSVSEFWAGYIRDNF